jgi:hypothetical protein
MMRAAICRDGGAYVNEPYEDSNVSMNFSVQASSGDINLSGWTSSVQGG